MRQYGTSRLPGPGCDGCRRPVALTTDGQNAQLRGHWAFIGGNGFRAVGVIQALEQDLARPVLTANQVAFWHALRLSGTHAPVVGYGQIFGREPPG